MTQATSSSSAPRFTRAMATSVVPMPRRSSSSEAREKMRRLASFTASTTESTVGSVMTASRVSTAMADATSPPWWPPMPSATANTDMSSMISFESWLLDRIWPTSLAPPARKAVMAAPPRGP